MKKNLWEAFFYLFDLIEDEEDPKYLKYLKQISDNFSFKEKWFIETKTNWREMECIFSELPKMLVNRVDLRINSWDEKVKHISKKIKQDWSLNSLMLDEMARVYATLWSKYDAVEKWISKEDFIKIYCKEE